MIEWALKRKTVPGRIIEAIIALYTETRTRVKTVARVSTDFNFGVGVQ